MVRRGVPGHTRGRIRRRKNQKGGILGLMAAARRMRPPPRNRYGQKGGLVLPRRRQKGGILPFLPLLIPGLIAAGKAAALGAVGGAAGYGAKKAIEAASK